MREATCLPSCLPAQCALTVGSQVSLSADTHNSPESESQRDERARDRRAICEESRVPAGD